MNTTALPPAYSTVNDAAVSSPPIRYDDPDALPAYEAQGPSGSSPRIDDLLPPLLRINLKDTDPLVKPSDLQAHLVLLGAFHRLREEVRTQKGKVDLQLEPDEMWAVFLQRAVHRFQLWVQRVIGNDDSDERIPGPLAPDECPPLDVMMVWHTYMLNPRTYYEDCLRMNHGLLKIGSFPLMQMASIIDHETLLPHPPSEARVSAFSSFTGQPFDPPIQTTSDHVVVLACPVCSIPNTIPWITYKGDGYAQRGFAVTCAAERCGRRFTRGTMGVRKFVEDMERCTSQPDKHVLANTLVDYLTGVPVEAESRQFTSLILRLHENPTPLRPEDMGSRLSWRFTDVEAYLRAGYLAKRNRATMDTPRGRELFEMIGMVPDHDDKVSQGALSTAYDNTAEVWKARFGVPYNVCGCLPPSAKSDSSLLASLFLKGKGKAVPPLSLPLPANARPDLISTDDVAADETHPSDHNSVAIINPGEQNAAQAQLRRKELDKRAKRLTKKLDRATTATGDKANNLRWGSMQLKRMEQDHTQAFLAPVEFGAKEPFGREGHGDCTVYSGQGVNGNFGAGECVKGNGNSGLCTATTDHPRPGIKSWVAVGAMMTGDKKIMSDYGVTCASVGYAVGIGAIGASGGGSGCGGSGCGVMIFTAVVRSMSDSLPVATEAFLF
ncbi:hypothetical protein FRB99_008773 [Tulasnella sp. 403]|nr:hypothetical protein FRB99_008773 [Tulasnella sp. 403]